MIALDTSVVSELMRIAPEPSVMTWFSGQDPARLHLTAVSEAEPRAGAAVLPAGRRRDRLVIEIDAVIGEDFAGRVLPFDSAAARAYAAIAASRRSLGRPILEADCQIAAIARARDAAIATRNARDFAQCGIVVIDPWMAGPAATRKPAPRPGIAAHPSTTVCLVRSSPFNSAAAALPRPAGLTGQGGLCRCARPWVRGA